MKPELFEQIAVSVESDPRSGQSLLLYALVKTLCAERGGHMYLLTKLKEMAPETRQLAYGLMETMAAGGASPADWQALELRLDEAVRGRG